MTFAGLCELVQARGWAICIASNHEGSSITPHDTQATLRIVAIYENRGDRRRQVPPIASARLDRPAITLDQAADKIGRVLQEAGVF